MSLFRVVFFGTPDFSVEALKALLEDDHFRVALVVSQPDRPAGRNMKVQMSPVKQLALARGVSVETPENVNAPEFLEKLREVNADAAVVVAFGQILSPAFLSIFHLKAVNVHASLLPRWRGAAPIQRALMDGDQESGVTLQIIVSKLDAGPVLGLRKIALTPEMNAGTLYESLKCLGAELLKVDFCDYLRGNLSPVMQEESQVTIARKIKKEEGLIRWDWTADKIFNYLRGLSLWPGIWTTRNGKNLRITAAKLVAAKKVWTEPGQVVEVGENFFKVACGEGCLEVSEVQPESRGKMGVAEYLRGYPVKTGEKLGV